MSVVLRCPSCGTTRGTLGECEACRDAQVQYFCTNHTPGVWLTAPRCTQCGGNFGDVPRKPAAAPAVHAARVRRSTRPVARGERVSRPPTPTATRSPAYEPELGREPELPAPSPWPSILGALVRARHLPATVVSERSGPGVGRVAGCLLRVVLVAVFLFLALLVALFVFGGALLQGLQPY